MTDVARDAGVSHQTVSRVLNGHPNVRPRTRALVLAVVDQLGYRPNPAARALATGRSRTLGVVTMPGTLFGPASTLYGIEQAARDAEYALSVVSVRAHTAAATAQAVAFLLKQNIDGVLVIAPLLSAVEGLTFVTPHIPLVVVGGPPSSDLPTVSVDQALGGRLATAHLLAEGHRTVWHVSGPAGWLEAEGRIEGWRAALTDAGADVPPPLSGDWSPQSGYEAGRVLALMPDVTAVFVANDQMALGVLRALYEGGRSVPDDLSIVGFDDLPEAGFFSPPLTTVRQHFEVLGRESLRALIDQIDDGGGTSTHAVIAPELVVRRSTAAPATLDPARAALSVST